MNLIFSWEQMATDRGVGALLPTVLTIPVVSHWLDPCTLHWGFFNCSSTQILCHVSLYPYAYTEPTKASSRGHAF